MPSKMVRFKEWFSKRHPVVKGLVVVGGCAAGVAAGLVAAPLVGAAASAVGFGVGAGTLSGAAASSAGLAAIGGGALSAGGLGVAGGTAIVGGSGALAGAASSAYAVHNVSKAGRKSRKMDEQASKECVDDGDICFEEC